MIFCDHFLTIPLHFFSNVLDVTSSKYPYSNSLIPQARSQRLYTLRIDRGAHEDSKTMRAGGLAALEAEIQPFQ